MPTRSKKEKAEIQKLAKRVAKNLEPGAKRNGPFVPEELIPFGIRRPMRSNYDRARQFHQTRKIFTAIAKELNTSVTLVYHLAALYMLEKINTAHREATGTNEVRLDISSIESETDYAPLEGPYKNWEARYAEVEQRLRSVNS